MPFAWVSRFFLRPAAPTNSVWNPQGIRDEWFAAHFNYAADVVADWIGAARLRNSETLNFGCGDGITDLALILRHGARRIVGVDISTTHRRLAALARREIALQRLPAALEFRQIEAGERLAGGLSPDIIISWSTFEHIETSFLDGVLADLFAALRPGGLFFLQINPLYHSPYGSHLGRFGLPPWAHLLMSSDELERAVMESTAEIPAEEIEENFHSRDLAAYKRFILDEYHKLNGLTAGALAARVQQHGFDILRDERRQVQIIPPPELLERFPREDLLTDDIMLLLEKPAPVTPSHS